MTSPWLHQLEYASARVEGTFGRIDILVNNAGIGGFSDALHNLPPEDWDRILNTNLRGVYYAIRVFAPLMIRAYTGHIINISSLAGKNALPNGAAYSASKWAFERADVLRSGRASPAQYTRVSHLSGIGGHRTESPCRERSEENAAVGGCGACGCDAGHASAAIVYE